MKALNLLLQANPVGLIFAAMRGLLELFLPKHTPIPEQKPEAQNSLNCISCGALAAPYVPCEHCSRVNYPYRPSDLAAESLHAWNEGAKNYHL